MKVRKRPPPVKVPLVPAAPPLVVLSAEYFPGTPQVAFIFDRAVDLSAAVPSEITVNDPVVNGNQYAGSGIVEVAPYVIVFNLEITGPASGSAVLGNVGSGNGLVAADNGGLWPAVTGLALTVEQ